MGRRGTDPGLTDRLTNGEYVIDAHAVAEAMLNRLARGELPRSAMLISGQVPDGRPVRSNENGAGSGARLA